MLCTVPDLLLEPARRQPDAAAVIDGPSAMTYRQLADRARSCAGFLSTNSSAGDRIALLLPRSAETLAVFFGAHLAGLVPVFIHDQLRPRQAAHIVGNAQAALAITTPRLRPTFRDCALPPGQIVDIGAVSGPPPLSVPRSIGRDLAVLAYTSGSTGSAKGVMLSHDNLVSGAVIVADYLGMSAADRTLALLPWSFDYGLNQVLATFAASGAVVIQRSAYPPDICRTLASAEVSGMAGVPALWTAMTGPHSPLLRHQYPCLRYLTNSGGTLPVTVIRSLRAAHPGTAIYAMYGLTEAFRSTFLSPALIDAKPTSIGQPIPNSDVLVIDDQDAICPAGAEGQFVHRGPTVAMGYWRDPAATAAVFRPLPARPRGSGQETVVYTGDYGYADADGDLYYRGRRDEMFKSRGIRTTPTEIESEILRSGLISDLVVTAMPDASAEPVILLAVQPRDQSFSLDALQDYCRTELAVHMRPHRITVMDPIPRTPHGKVDRVLVRQMLAGRPGGEQAS